MTLQEQNFIKLLSASVQSGITPVLQDPSYEEIYKIAENHAVKSLLYPALKKCLPFGDPFLVEMKRQSFATATRISMQSKDLSKIYTACESEKIPVLPLKGCVIKDLYPYPELRFMSDADLLVPEHSRNTVRTLMESQGFLYHKVDAGDTDVYISPLRLNYEIHLGLNAEGFSDKTSKFTSDLMKFAFPTQGNPYLMELPPEEHYLYILIHFIKHFIYGGVGIRQLTDLFICYTRWDLDLGKVNSLLEGLELTAFHSNLKALWEHWFMRADASREIHALGEFILHSGVFGNEEQRATDRILSESNGNNYVLRRLFPSYRTMKGYFPILQKLPFLLPFAWVWRAIRAVLFRRDKLNTELNTLSRSNESLLDNRREFYHRYGLSVYNKK